MQEAIAIYGLIRRLGLYCRDRLMVAPSVFGHMWYCWVFRGKLKCAFVSRSWQVAYGKTCCGFWL